MRVSTIGLFGATHLAPVSGAVPLQMSSPASAGLACVLASLLSPPGEPVAILGRAEFDPETGEIEHMPLPALDADGAPAWLFWAGSQLTSSGAATLIKECTGWDEETGVWVELRHGAG